MEHAHPIDRGFSWRGAVLAAALVLVIALAAAGGWALLDRLSGTRPVPGTGHGSTGHVPASVPLRPRAETPVLVLNGDGLNGAAGGVSSRLHRAGYRRTPATNAQATTYARSLVLYRPGWEQAARRLAQDARIPTIAPLDGVLPAGDSRYPLVVVVGR